MPKPLFFNFRTNSVPTAYTSHLIGFTGNQLTLENDRGSYTHPCSALAKMTHKSIT